MNILKELFFGNVYPYEKQTSRNSELDNLRQLVLRNEKAMSELLTTDEQKERFEKYRDCLSEMSRLTEIQNFENGFRLGARIMLEVMDDSKVVFEEQ